MSAASSARPSLSGSGPRVRDRPNNDRRHIPSMPTAENAKTQKVEPLAPQAEASGPVSLWLSSVGHSDRPQWGRRATTYFFLAVFFLPPFFLAAFFLVAFFLAAFFLATLSSS